MTDFGKVGVLMGGSSAEREISLRTGNGVLKALLSHGIDAHAFDPAKQSVAELAAQKFDRVFIALHGRFGEDGSIQGTLELLGIPYTGSGVMASALAMDKIFTKRIWQTHGLSTPNYRVINAKTTTNLELVHLPAELGLPLIVKAPHEGSTIGITKVELASDLKSAVTLSAEFDDQILVEQFIEGHELTVTILDSGMGPEALPIIEIVAPDGNYDYENKYNRNETRYLCPAPLEPSLTTQIQEMAVEAFKALDCQGWGRVDVMLSKNGYRPYLLEINTSPGMTDHSLVPMAAKAIGVDYAELCVTILKSASLKIKHTPEGQH